MKKTVALLAFVAGVLAGSASAAMTHTAATIDTRTDVLMDELPEGTPVTPMIDDDGQLVIVLSTNITGSLTIPADLGSVTLDLNGWSIKGTNGVDGTETTFGGDGGAAVIVKGASGADAGATRITVVDERSDRVQLWENGPYFASCNVGATKPEEYGYYFWWGDTVGYTNNGSAWISVVDGTTPISFAESSTPANTTYNKSYSELKSMGYIDDEANPVLNAANDAARAYLKGDWRMPTSDEIRALVDNCTREWTTTNGVCGYIVRGKDDYASKSIFLPAAGYGLNSTTTLLGSDGYYWSSTPTSDSLYSFDLYFHSGTFSRQNGGRWSGMPVRPVTSTGDGRPDPGPGPAEVVGGNGGDGNPPGTGSFAIVDGSGAEYAAVTDPDGLVTKGEDGKNLRDEAVKETFDEPEWVVTGPDSDGWYTVILTQDLTGPVEIPDDLGKVKIDLNGWNITGTNGDTGDAETPGTDGGNGIIIVHNEPQRCDPSNYWLINEAGSEEPEGRPDPGTGTHGEDGDGVVAGGNGGAGHEPGDGAAVLVVAEGATPAAVTVGNDEDGSDNPVTVKGGNGGNGLGTDEDGNGIAGGDGGETGGKGGEGGDDVGGEGPAGGKGTTTDGEDGEDGKATPQSLWIADHADAGEGYVNLAIQVNLPTGTTLTAELAEKYAANFKAVCAATEADFDKATPQSVTFAKLANGLIWVKMAVPAIDSRLLWKVACPKL